jgi:hypothetical protein
LEKLPDYDGPAETDDALNYALIPHRTPDGVAHIGNLAVGIPDEALENMNAREQIEKEMWGAKAEFASFKDTLVEDAGKCYSAHGRPKLGCVDYKDDKKRLGNPRTKSARAGKIYLCDFCVVHSFVTSEIMSQQLSVPRRVIPPRRRNRRRR